MSETYRPAKIVAGAAAAATVIWLGSGWIAGGNTEHREDHSISGVPTIEPTPTYDSALDRTGPEVADESDIDSDESGLTAHDLAQFAIEGALGTGSEDVEATPTPEPTDDTEYIDDSEDPCGDGYVVSLGDGSCIPESEFNSDPEATDPNID